MRRTISVRPWTLGLIVATALCLGPGLAPGASAALEYVGSSKCKVCHKAEYEAWMKEKHSRAMASLKPGEQKKADCLACHTTGYGKAAKPGADLADVGCEACHGPASGYKDVKIMHKKKWQKDPQGQLKLAVAAGLIPKPDQALCVSCHNRKSPTFKGFNFKEAVQKVKHK
jgi:hypothetical protein